MNLGLNNYKKVNCSLTHLQGSLRQGRRWVRFAWGRSELMLEGQTEVRWVKEGESTLMRQYSNCCPLTQSLGRKWDIVQNSSIILPRAMGKQKSHSNSGVKNWVVGILELKRNDKPLQPLCWPPQALKFHFS